MKNQRQLQSNGREAMPEAVAPLVTIVISFRERWRFTLGTIQSIIANTTGDFLLWVLDTGMPEDVRESLRPYVEKGRLQILDLGPGYQPNDARGSIIARLRSRYAVFIDNDALVTIGWLDKMVACAEATGAGIVCPLYLWGESEGSDLIHMAGGDLTVVQEEGGVRISEHHRHFKRRIAEVSNELRREVRGFGEFHCLMMRREVYSAEGMFDPQIASVHEHIHASLRARELGFETWFEPDAHINYLAFAPWRAGDLRDFRRRWDYSTAERSLEGFARRWGAVDDAAYRHHPLNFVTSHVGYADVLDPRPWLASNRDRAMSREDLQQTFGGWTYLATRTGYSIDDVALFANAVTIALEATDGAYRPCGRAFSNHLVGTASVLTFYGCPMHQILAGLFHAAFSLPAAAELGERRPIQEAVGELSPTARHAINLARLYSQRERLLSAAERPGTRIDELTTEVASLFVLEAANELEMYLSFEVPLSGRTDVIPEQRWHACRQLLNYVGLPGLAGSLQTVRGERLGLPTVNFGGAGKGSFRFDGRKIVSAYA